MSKKPINIDEREMNIFRNICTTLYIITLFSLIGMQLYRQFILHQSQEEWNDIALLIAFNVVVLLGSVLYVSGIHRKVSDRKNLTNSAECMKMAG